MPEFASLVVGTLVVAAAIAAIAERVLAAIVPAGLDLDDRRRVETDFPESDLFAGLR